MDLARLRYVVLRHEGVADPHFDLMIETSPGSELATWRVSEWPPVTGAKLVRLPAHRSSYLTYEGSISGGRGSVKRVASGTCELIELSSTVWMIRFDNAWVLRLISRGQQDLWDAQRLAV